MRSVLKALATTALFLAVVVCCGGAGVVLVFTGEGAQIAMGAGAVLVSLVIGVRLMFVGLDWAYSDRRKGRHV